MACDCLQRVCHISLRLAEASQAYLAVAPATAGRCGGGLQWQSRPLHGVLCFAACPPQRLPWVTWTASWRCCGSRCAEPRTSGRHPQPAFGWLPFRVAAGHEQLPSVPSNCSAEQARVGRLLSLSHALCDGACCRSRRWTRRSSRLCVSKAAARHAHGAWCGTGRLLRLKPPGRGAAAAASAARRNDEG